MTATRLPIALVLAALQAGCGAGPGTASKSAGKAPGKKAAFAGAPPVVPTLTRDVRAALAGRDFARLEAMLAERHARYLEDPGTEQELVTAVYAIPADDPVAPDVDAWIAARPSAAAHAARGRIRAFAAHEARGDELARNTTEAQFAAYEELGAQARADLREALHLDPRWMPAYWELVEMEHVERDERRRLFEEGLALDPTSLVLRVGYMHLLQPKWGGSLEEMEKVAQDAQPHAAANPRLRALLGWRETLAAAAARLDGDYQEAERQLSLVLEKGQIARDYRLRADTRALLAKYREAIEDCDRGLAISPENGPILAIRGRCYVNLRQFERGIEDLDVALEIWPKDGYALYARAYAFTMLQRVEEAAADAKRAVAESPELGAAWALAGSMLVKLGRGAEAVPYLEKGVTMVEGDSRSQSLFSLATAHYLQRDEACLPLLESFAATWGASPPRAHAPAVAWAQQVLAAPAGARWDFVASNPIKILPGTGGADPAGADR